MCIRDRNQYILDAAKEVPVIIVNGYLKGENVYCSLCDDEQAIYRLTSRILADGRRAPIYLYRSLSYSGRQKLAGFKRACQEYDLAPDAGKAFCLSGDILSARDRLLADRQFLNYDAFITSDDDMAVSVLKFAQASGRKVPDDMCITCLLYTSRCV